MATGPGVVMTQNGLRYGVAVGGRPLRLSGDHLTSAADSKRRGQIKPQNAAPFTFSTHTGLLSQRSMYGVRIWKSNSSLTGPVTAAWCAPSASQSFRSESTARGVPPSMLTCTPGPSSFTTNTLRWRSNYTFSAASVTATQERTMITWALRYIAGNLG